MLSSLMLLSLALALSAVDYLLISGRIAASRCCAR